MKLYTAALTAAASIFAADALNPLYLGVAMPKQNSRIWTLGVLNLLNPTKWNLTQNVEGLKFRFGALWWPKNDISRI